MLHELDDENQGLKMNKAKTKVMKENDTYIYVITSQTDSVNIVPGQGYILNTTDYHTYMQRRITVRWTAFAKHPDIVNGNISTCLKIQSATHAYFQL